MRRRSFVRQCVLGAGAVIGAPMLNFGRSRLYARAERQYSVRTLDLVRTSLVVDMLGLLTEDWPLLQRWHDRPESFADRDYEQLLRSGVSVLHPAVDLNLAPDVHGRTTIWLEAWNRFLAAHSSRFVRVHTVADVAAAKAGGKIGVLLGMQNSEHFRNVEDVQRFYKLGQRVSQLTYNEANRIGSGCRASYDAGLTAFGASIVAAMNAANMIIDVSHAGERTTLDTFAASRRPVLITHSNCRALANHPRCKSDEVLRTMARQGGVMGVTSIRAFVSQQQNPSLADKLNHFDHIAKVAGIEHAGIGSDAGVTGENRLLVRELCHPLRIYDLVEGLISRGYTDSHIRLVLGGNFQRVFSQTIA